MNALATAQATEADQITVALGAILAAILVADETPSLLPPEAAQTFDQVVTAYIDRMEGWTQAQRQTDRLLGRPVAQALRNAVRTFGRRLHEIGGLSAMHDAMMKACEHENSWIEGKLESVVDHCWDGIGDWLA